MGQRTFGNVTITFPDDATPSERAGRLSTDEQSMILKAHVEVAATAINTAKVLATNSDRFYIKGATAEGLDARGNWPA